MLTHHLEGFPIEGQVAVPGWERGAVLLLQALQENNSSSAAPIPVECPEQPGPSLEQWEWLPEIPVPSGAVQGAGLG